VRQTGETIERISGLKVGELDFTDDRLTLLLRRLRNEPVLPIIIVFLPEARRLITDITAGSIKGI